MNRFIEKRGECYALKSAEILGTLSGADDRIVMSISEFHEELKVALRLANCIALAPYAAPVEKRPIYEQLNRNNNEWQSIGRQAWLNRYKEEPKRTCAYRTYGPTLRIKYPCGYVGFKGLPNQNGDIYADFVDENPEKKSIERLEVERLLKAYEPDIRSCSIDRGQLITTVIEWTAQDRKLFDKPAPEPTPAAAVVPPKERKYQICDEGPFKNWRNTNAHHWRDLSTNRKKWPDLRILETDGTTTTPGMLLDPKDPSYQPFYKYWSGGDRPSRTRFRESLEALHRLGNQLRDLEKSRKRLEANGISFQVKATCTQTPKAGPGVKFVRLKYYAATNEWKELPVEPLEAESLDPKACRQFVEQLLAFDELEAKRAEDIQQLKYYLLLTPTLSLFSYVAATARYGKC